MRKFKPKCKLIGEDGNIYNLWGITARVLEKNGLKKESLEMGERIQKSKSYYEALNIISDYVTVVGTNEEISENNSYNIESKKSKNILKLYSPLTAFYYENDTDEMIWLDNEELIECKKKISQAINKYSDFLNESGLVEYYDRNEEIKEKLERAFPTVQVYKGILYGVMDIKIKNGCNLSEEEISKLKKYIEGQYSDGWGEGFEQREVETEMGNINISFWSKNPKYFIKTGKEMEVMTMNKDRISELKNEYPKGTRIELNAPMVDENDMPEGLQGTVKYVDDIGGIGVEWDNGRTLSIIPEVDSFSKIEIGPSNEMKM